MKQSIEQELVGNEKVVHLRFCTLCHKYMPRRESFSIMDGEILCDPCYIVEEERIFGE